LVTTSGILQEQKFSNPRSIGYLVTGMSVGSVVVPSLDKLQELLVELPGEVGKGWVSGS
jgi:hypothetical protein